MRVSTQTQGLFHSQNCYITWYTEGMRKYSYRVWSVSNPLYVHERKARCPQTTNRSTLQGFTSKEPTWSQKRRSCTNTTCTVDTPTEHKTPSTLRRSRHVEKKKDESEIVKLSQISQTPVIFMYLNSLTVLWTANLLNAMTSGAKYEIQPAANIREPTEKQTCSFSVSGHD